MIRDIRLRLTDDNPFHVKVLRWISEMDKGRSRSTPLGNHVAAALNMYIDVAEGRFRLCPVHDNAHPKGHYQDAPAFNPDVMAFAQEPLAHPDSDDGLTDEIKISRIIEREAEVQPLRGVPPTNVSGSPLVKDKVEQSNASGSPLVKDKVEQSINGAESRSLITANQRVDEGEPIGQVKRSHGSIGRNSLFDIADSDGGMTDQY